MTYRIPVRLILYPIVRMHVMALVRAQIRFTVYVAVEVGKVRHDVRYRPGS